MKTPIETDLAFRLRLEDFIYLILVLYTIPLIGFIVTQSSHKNGISPITNIILLSGIGILVIAPILLIIFSYRKRLRDHYYIEDESVVRERDGKEIFRIPFREIVSVRVNNKKGTRGSIIFFTEARSKQFTYYDSLMGFYNTPLAAFGFTKKKIDLVKNRKQLLTAIYRVNPELHFIE